MPHLGDRHTLPGWFALQCSHLCINLHGAHKHLNLLKSMQMGTPVVVLGGLVAVGRGILCAIEG